MENCGPESGLIDCGTGQYSVVNYVLPVLETAPCTPVEIFASVDLNSNGILDFVALQFDSLELFLNVEGSHTINYVATDRCGNTTECDKNVTIGCIPTGIQLAGCSNESLVVDCSAGVAEAFSFSAGMFGPPCSDKPFIRAEVDLDSDGIDDFVYQEFDTLVQYTISTPGTHSVELEAFICGEAVSCTKNITVECEDSSNPVGGSISPNNGTFDSTADICNGGSLVESIVVFASGHAGENFACVLLDEQGTILSVQDAGQSAVASYSVDLLGINQTSIDSLFLLHVAYSTVITGLNVGGNVNNLNGDFGISNTIKLLLCENQVVTFSATDCSDEVLSIPCNQNVFSTIDVGYEHPNCNNPATITVEVDFDDNGVVDQTIFAQGFSFNDDFILPDGFHKLTYTINACGDVIQCTEFYTVNCINGTLGTVSGRIVTEDLVPVAEVLIDLEGANVQVEGTDSDGEYAFPAMAAGGSYMLSPLKDGNYLEGVSTIDLILIQRHVLGIQELDSPYKLIAADIDQSGSINGIDLVELRKLILGVYSELPNNTSWRIIDANQDFSGLQSPFVTQIRETHLINNLQSDMVVDFIGVKIGDVDNSIETLSQEDINLRQTSLSISINEVPTGDDTKKYIVKGIDNILVDGFQFSLKVGADMAEILNVTPLGNALDYNNFNMEALNEGEIVVSWNGTQAISFDNELFEITLLPAMSLPSQELVIMGKRLEAQVYTDQAIHNLSIGDATEAVEVITLYQNNPNPWSEFTEIKFKMPNDNDIALSIYDLNGKLFYQEQKRAHKGMNVIRVSKSDINSSGVLYYELLSDDSRYVQKMILLD